MLVAEHRFIVNQQQRQVEEPDQVDRLQRRDGGEVALVAFAGLAGAHAQPAVEPAEEIAARFPVEQEIHQSGQHHAQRGHHYQVFRLGSNLAGRVQQRRHLQRVRVVNERELHPAGPHKPGGEITQPGGAYLAVLAHADPKQHGADQTHGAGGVIHDRRPEAALHLDHYRMPKPLGQKEHRKREQADKRRPRKNSGHPAATALITSVLRAHQSAPGKRCRTHILYPLDAASETTEDRL